MEEGDKPIDRETLYKEVWAAPVTVVASNYGLSDVGLAKICRSLTIPLPSRGYWAKVKAGRVMARPTLPKLKYASPVETGLKKLPPEQAAIREAARKASILATKESLPMPPTDEPLSHPLVRAASKRLRQRDGWPEDTLLRSAPKEVLNLAVTRDALDRALGVVDAVAKVLKKQSFEFELDTERGETLVKWLATGTKLQFLLKEHIRRNRHETTPAEQLAQKRYWERSRGYNSADFPHIPMYDYTPTGVLTIKVGNWPSRSWKDTPRTRLERRLGEIAGGILALAQETHAKNLDAERKAEVRRLAEERYEFLTERRADETERFNQLEAQATDLDRAAKLRFLADAAENRARADGGISVEQAEWLAWVRAKADWLDPLIEVSDLILDAPEPKHPGYW